MKKRYLFLVPLSCMLLLACQNGNSQPNNSNNSDVSSADSILSESQSGPDYSSLSTEPLEKIASPVLSVNESLVALSWNKVTNASGYSVEIDDGAPSVISSTLFELSKEEGNHTVKVIAKGASGYADSDPATYIYNVEYTSIGELTYANGVITWASSNGLGIQYKTQNSEYENVQGNSIAATQADAYTVKAKSGYKQNSGAYDVFYVDNAQSVSSRTIIISKPATQNLILEAGMDRSDTGLQEKYVAYRYVNGTGWTKSINAAINLDQSNEGYTDGKCVKFSFWHHGDWYKWEKQINITGTYNTIRLFAKGEKDSELILSFEIQKTKQFGDLLIKGIYITYTIKFDAEEWKEYVISMADPNWKVDFGDGKKISGTELVAALQLKGIKINSLADVLPYFDAFQFRCRAPYINGGPNTYSYVDEARMDNSGAETSIKQIVKVKDLYALQAGNYAGEFVPGESGKGVINLNKPAKMSLNVDYEVTADNQLKITSTSPGFDFVGLLNPIANGNEFELDTASGANAADLNGLKLASYALVEGFESYTDTGTGYDIANNDPDTRTGLRADYYSDYYNGGSDAEKRSPMGGNGWELMGSTDYLALNEDAENAHRGTKSMRIKYNKDNDCRYTTYGLSDGTATPLPSGSYFSFWTKGVSGRDSVLKVKVFYTEKVTPSNQTGDGAPFTQEIFTIPADSDWVECKIALKAGKVYYGFMINPVKNNGAATEENRYVYIDDVTIYNSISPWGE